MLYSSQNTFLCLLQNGLETFWEAGSKAQHLPNSADYFGSLQSSVSPSIDTVCGFLGIWPAMSTVPAPQPVSALKGYFFVAHLLREQKRSCWYDLKLVGSSCQRVAAEREFPQLRSTCSLRVVERLNPVGHAAI